MCTSQSRSSPRGGLFNDMGVQRPAGLGGGSTPGNWRPRNPIAQLMLHAIGGRFNQKRSGNNTAKLPGPTTVKTKG